MICNSDSYYWNFINFKAIYGFVGVWTFSWFGLALPIFDWASTFQLQQPPTQNNSTWHAPPTPNTICLAGWSVPCPWESFIISTQSCRTTRGCIGCFVSDILSIGRFEQLRRANFNCFDHLGTARVYLSNRPMPWGSTAPIATMSTPPDRDQKRDRPRWSSQLHREWVGAV
jgi:hypothetical protein